MSTYIFIWLLIATFNALVTKVIYTLLKDPYSTEKSHAHWFHWVLLPFVLVFLVLYSLFILCFRKNKYSKIIHNTMITVYRLCGDWTK